MPRHLVAEKNSRHHHSRAGPSIVAAKAGNLNGAYQTIQAMCAWGVTVQFYFGKHKLDADRRELRRGSTLVAVEPQVFDLLVYLVKNRDRVVTKDDLIASVWGGRIVSDSTLSS